MEKLDVLCVSLVNLNILVRPVNESVFERDVTIADDYQVVVGGDGTNQAVVLSSLGRTVGVCGNIGADPFGQLAMRMLTERNVKTDQIIVCPEEKTAVCLVMIKKDGSRNFIVKRGACDRFTAQDIPADRLNRTKILNIGSLFTFKRLYGDDLAAILKAARKQGVLTSADCMYDTYQIGVEEMKPVLAQLDYFLPSYEEARYLTGRTDPEEMADALLGMGVKTAIIKLGGKGCLLKSAEESLLLPAFDVPVVDTTGAGDNFIAGFLHGVLNGWSLLDCGRFASAAAAVSVGTIGATGAVKSEKQIFNFLEMQSRND